MARSSYVRVYVHYAWATWDRLPLITPNSRDALYRIILAKTQSLGAHPLALGGIEDHVHFLVRLPATIAIANLIGEIKGASAHAMTHQISPGKIFKWQGAYGAFCVGEQHLITVQSYIQHQEDHHHTLQTCSEWQIMQTAEEDD